MIQHSKKFLGTALLLSLGLSSAGCASHAGEGALIGGAAGAGLGAIIGHNSHHRTAEGALVGGAIGALGGGLIGNEADKRERYRDRYADRYYDRRYDDRYYSCDPYYTPPRYDRETYEYRRYGDGS